MYSWPAQKVQSMRNDFVIINLKMVLLDTYSKNATKRSFWLFYPKNILQSLSLCKKLEYFVSIILWFQIGSNVYMY